MRNSRRLVPAFDPELLPADLSWAELEPPLDCDTANVIDSYHTQTDLATLILEPVPENVSSLAPELGKLLCKNTTLFDEEVEDEIASDPVIEAILAARRQHVYPENDLTRIFRARRTIVAYLFQKCT